MVMSEMMEAISIAYEQLDPPMEKNRWTIMQLEALLDSILVANPELKSYYKDFADNLRML